MTARDNHPACECGCGELADECMGPNPNPFGNMTIVHSQGTDRWVR